VSCEEDPNLAVTMNGAQNLQVRKIPASCLPNLPLTADKMPVAKGDLKVVAV
jgi:hypothetical protein